MTLAWPSPLRSSPYRMPQSPAPDDALRGAELVTDDGRALALIGATLRVSAGGGIARAVLEQTFENPHDETLRVTYRMPLPADGAVSGYAFEIGGRTVAGRVDPKARARERFEQALVAGKTAALLEQSRADVFTQEIGNLPARERLVARITVDQRLAWLAAGEWELRFPTVIGPRYLAATDTPEDARDVGVEVAPQGIAARVHLELAVRDAITRGRRIESPSHALRAKGDGAVELSALEGARLDRDIVVRWAVAAPEVGLAVRAARPVAAAPHAHHAYGLLTIVPPSPDARLASVPRDLIVLLDTSGSMDGPPLAQAKRVVGSLIASLGESDRLELVEFGDRPNRYQRDAVPGTAAEKQRAIRWLEARRASGGTEMRSGILEALRTVRPGAQRQVVLVTDGYAGGEQQLVTTLHESLPAGCRMHVAGVGSAVNRTLSTSIARAGRGADLLGGLDEDAEKAARALLDRTSAPVLTDLVVEGDAVVEHAPEHLPDVFAGAPVRAALRLRAEGGDIVVRGRLATGAWEQRLRVGPVAPGDGEAGIVALYARERVADLETRWTMGRDTAAIDREIESVGVVFQIATRQTSWVAIDEDRTVDPTRGSRREEIPQELPYGTSMASFGLAAAPMSFGQQAFGMALAGGAPRPAAMMPPAPASMDLEDAPATLVSDRRERAPSFPSAPARHARAEMGLGEQAARSKKRRIAPALVVLFFLLAIVALVVWLLTR